MDRCDGVSFSDPRNQLSSWECSGQGGRVYSSPIPSAARESMAELASDQAAAPVQSSLALWCCNPQLVILVSIEWGIKLTAKPIWKLNCLRGLVRQKLPHDISLLILAEALYPEVEGAGQEAVENESHEHNMLMFIFSQLEHEPSMNDVSAWSWPKHWRH